eukprot:743406-Amorphochlora_amoeboformis.AAC.1
MHVRINTHVETLQNTPSPKVDALLYYLSRYLEIKMGYLTILASCAGNRTEALPPGVVSIR